MRVRVGRLARRAGVILAAAGLSCLACPGWAGASEAVSAPAALPDAPDPQTPSSSPPPKKEPCPQRIVNGVATGSDPPVKPGQVGQSPTPCKITWRSRYEIFVNGPQDKPLKPRDKAWLAVRNVADPFNNITILEMPRSPWVPIRIRPTAPECGDSGATWASVIPRT